MIFPFLPGQNMKNAFQKLFVVSLLSVAFFASRSQDTNVSFLPENYGFEPYQQVVEKAIKAGECRPAEQDPDGHWGRVNYGFQMSIRSQTNVFTASNPIPVAVILRNVSTNTLIRFYADSGREVYFTIEDGNGHIQRTHDPAGYSSVGGRDFRARYQIKHEYDLNYEFHLSAGVYKVRADQLIFEQPAYPGVTNWPGKVLSGEMTIQVIPK